MPDSIASMEDMYTDRVETHQPAQTVFEDFKKAAEKVDQLGLDQANIPK